MGSQKVRHDHIKPILLLLLFQFYRQRLCLTHGAVARNPDLDLGSSSQEFMFLISNL